MNTSIKTSFLPLIFLTLLSCNAPGKNENTIVAVKTTLGDFKIRLYDDTPVHRDNFIKLVNMGFYNGVSFHRVIKNFMIQAGDPDTRTGLSKQQLDTLRTYTLPAEFRDKYYHKKGAVAAAREGNDVNPEMRSSGTQFYIVQGLKLNDDEIKAAEGKINSNIKQALFTRLLKDISDSARKAGVTLQENEMQEHASMKMFDYLASHKDYKFSPEQVQNYTTIGGVPRLDGTYTVFGEVVEGLDVVDKIAAVATNQSDKPISDVRIIKMKIVSK